METIQTNSLMTDRKINIPLTAKIKDAILNNQVKTGAAAGLIAGTVFVSGRYFSPILETEPAPVAQTPPVSGEYVAQTAGSYKSFEEAFYQQRTSQGAGGIFEYHGKTYNTYFKEEWESMSSVEKQEYFTSINERLNPEDCKILVSDGDGTVATLSFDQQQIMQLEVLDENHDGIIDIASIDINFDGVADYTFPVESVVVHPESEAGTTSQNIIIDDNSPEFYNEYEQVDQDDLTLIKDESEPSVEDQNIFNDDDIIDSDLPDIVDDFDMDEFNNL